MSRSKNSLALELARSCLFHRKIPTTRPLFIVLPDGSTTWLDTRWRASSRGATCGKAGRTVPPSSMNFSSTLTGASTTSTGSG